ncbi:MAG TPA: undecaprenyl-phosphate glucose phosphotransferase, partial [Bacteroidales bacterium]|nr:undecaprenyl-phosphate glucose phosphotransferase [Bacteroidales bacterium]
MTDTLTREPPIAIARPDFNRSLNGFFKRAFDLLGALLGLIILSPFFLLIGIWIKRESPGPVF